MYEQQQYKQLLVQLPLQNPQLAQNSILLFQKNCVTETRSYIENHSKNSVHFGFMSSETSGQCQSQHKITYKIIN